MSITQSLFLLVILMVSIDRAKSFNYDESTVVVLVLVHFLLIASLFLVHLLVLIPRYLDRQRYGFYLIGVSIVFVVVILVGQYADAWLTLDPESQVRLFLLAGARQVFFTHLFVLLAGFPFRLARQRQEQRQLLLQMEAYQKEAELQFLKEQVNPHFLLNVLNNTYSLTSMEMPEAGPTIQKLTSMMQYMLLDCQNALVPLKQELQYLDDYLQLQQLRKDGLLNIEFEQKGELDSVWIEPLLFIPFFENVFKHGNLENLEAGFLKAKMALATNKLRFQIENSLADRPQKRSYGGVGLENIRQRLALLYADRHHLKIQQETELFSVEVELILQTRNLRDLDRAQNT